MRQAYDYWQDQPDYYPQAIPLNGFSEEIPREWQSKVVRFNKELYVPSSNTNSKSTSAAVGFVLSWLATN